MKNIALQKNKGYTLLFAVLVSSVVLAVGISILTISKKEFLLSSSARESTSAIYVSESALECAIFNFDNNTDGFSSTSPATSVRCMNQDVAMDSGADTNTSHKNGYSWNFEVKMATPSSNACAIVSIDRYVIDDPDNPDNSGPVTVITSRGYNLGWDAAYAGINKCSSPNSASPRRVERAIQYTVHY